MEIGLNAHAPWSPAALGLDASMVSQALLQETANATLRLETLRETVCDAIVANGVV